MAGSEALYRFLSEKLKERKIQVDSLPRALGISRSTLYRNMKGTAHMSLDVRERLADTIGLDDEEQVEFERLLGLASIDSTLIGAREILDHFVFSSCDQSTDARPTSLRFGLYDGDIYLRTSDQVFAMICRLVAQPGVSTQAWIVNCSSEWMFGSVESLVRRLFAAADDVAVEHLLILSQSDYAAAARTLTRLVPLLQFSRYTVRPGDGLSAEDGCLFGNTIMVQISHSDAEPTCFVLSFLENDLSTCLVTSDSTIVAFFRSNYEAARSWYGEALVDVDSSDMETFSDALADIEDGHDVFIVMPDLCYERIPMQVYGSALSRLTEAEVTAMKQQMAGTSRDPSTILEMALGSIERRAVNSESHKHIDVCSVKGLTAFAHTGRLSDHVDCIPLFSREERAVILEHALRCNSDAHDSYRLLVTRDELFPDGHMAVVVDDVGVMLTYNPSGYRQGLFTNLFIRNHKLTELFSDYVQNHVPVARAMNEEETVAFLDSLISQLRDEPGKTDSSPDA